MRLRVLARLVTVIALLSSSAAISRANSVPYIDQPLVPAAVAPGGAGFTLTINGAGFNTTSTVRWNGSPRPTTFVSSSQLTVVISAADVATETTASITVANPGGGGGIPNTVSNTVFFQVSQRTSSVAYGSSTQAAGLPQGVFPVQVVEGDVNGDGKPDIVTLNSNVSISILLGNGDGTFQPASYSGPITSQPNAAAQRIVLGDFNGDGKLDFAVSYSFFDDIQGFQMQVLVLLGAGNGTFTGGPIIAFRHSAFAGGTTFLAADFNQSGTLDLVMDFENGSGNGLLVLGGNGDGTFGLEATIPTAGGPLAAAVADLNGDGRPDLVVTYNNVLAVALNNGNPFNNPCPMCPPQPLLGPVTTVDTLSQPGAFGLAVTAADFNGDGIPDLAFAFQTCVPGNPCTANLQTYAGIGNGTFQSGVPSGGTLDALGTNFVVGDFNADGILDLAFAEDVLLGRGDGTFAVNTVLSQRQNNVVAADFNDDGALDFFGESTQGPLLLQLRILPDFSTSFPTTTASAPIGQSATYGINVTPSNGFLGDVQFDVTGLPPNSSASFSANPLTGGSGTTTLTVSTTNSTPQGQYLLTVTATSGSLTHSTGLILNVTADFNVSVTPAQQSVRLGNPAKFQGSVTPVAGFTGNVSISVSGLPTNTTIEFDPAAVIGGSGKFEFTISANANTVPGTYTVMVTGTGSGQSSSATITLTVSPKS